MKTTPGGGELGLFKGTEEMFMPLKKTNEKTTKITNAWTTLAPTATLSGMTLDDYKNKVQPTFDTRATIKKLEAQQVSAQYAPDTADQATAKTNQLIVNAVKGDPAHGEDNDLYQTMGYVRKSARKTGLPRKSTNATEAVRDCTAKSGTILSNTERLAADILKRPPFDILSRQTTRPAIQIIG